MTEAEWLAIADPRRLLEKVLPAAHWERRMLLLSVACVRRVEHLLTVPACRDAMDVAEQAAGGASGPDKAASFRALWAAHDAARATRGRLAADKAATWAAFPNPTHGFLEAARIVTLLLAGGDAETKRAVRADQCAMIRDVFGPAGHAPVVFDPGWRSAAVVGIAETMYAGREFGAMPVLADALEEAGCAAPAVLAHCREPGLHIRGCWVVDGVLGKTAEPGAAPDGGRKAGRRR